MASTSKLVEESPVLINFVNPFSDNNFSIFLYDVHFVLTSKKIVCIFLPILDLKSSLITISSCPSTSILTIYFELTLEILSKKEKFFVLTFISTLLSISFLLKSELLPE